MRSITASLTLGIGSGLVTAALVLGFANGLFPSAGAGPKRPPEQAAAGVSAPVASASLAPAGGSGAAALAGPAAGQAGKREIYVYIPVNLSAQEIGEVLQQAGVVSNPEDFVAAAQAQGVTQRLQRGLFHFTEGESVGAVLQKVAHGRP